MDKNNFLRKLPAVDEIIKDPSLSDLPDRFPRNIIVKTIQGILEDKRKLILSGDLSREPALKNICAEAREKLFLHEKPSLKKTVNATGIIIHTNLGRAPLPKQALQHIINTSEGYVNLEFDLDTGKRGARYRHAETLLQELTGAESAFIVNNNAAAVLLCLNTLAKDKEVIVSRGELIEIGGSFRIPDIMHQSGAILREVGTTNRTHPDDYLNAVNEHTALILKTHTSNYRIVGFTAEVDIAGLKHIGHKHHIPVMMDLGSGNLVDPARLGLSSEPTVSQTLKLGADIVTFSGDKLLGGPQSGIILGSETLLKPIRENPLSRALRIDKLALAGIEAVLRILLYSPDRIEHIPVLGMLKTPLAVLKKRAETIKKRVRQYSPGMDVIVCEDFSQPGGGSFPDHSLPTWVVSLNTKPLSISLFESALRKAETPVVARTSHDRILFDMRTVFPDELKKISDTVISIFERNKLT